MLCKAAVTTDTLRELVIGLEVPEERVKSFTRIQEICKNCRSSSPMICMELCQIWNIKKKYLSTFTDITEKLSITELLKLVRSNRRQKILLTLIGQPHSLQELSSALKSAGYHHSLKHLYEDDIEPLRRAGLLDVNKSLYHVTFKGETVYNLSSMTEVSKLPIHSQGFEEQILTELQSGPKTSNEFVTQIPSRTLFRSLKRLKNRDLITKENLSGRIFYFATKRRPTRKLSKKEMQIFKALPKTGITVQDLSKKVGISVREIYRYLRHLKYKRHVRKQEKSPHYTLTETGRNLMQSLNLAYNLLNVNSK